MISPAKRILILAIGLAVAGCGGGSNSSTKLSGGQVARRVLSADFDAPMQYVANSANSHLAYVIERAGRVRVLVDDVLTTAPVLDITSSVSTDGECGLLGMTLAPDFASSHQFYLHFDAASPVQSRIVRYTMNSDGLSASPSESTIIEIDQPFLNHKGGSIHFGSDGYLYLAMGDGGSGNDPGNRAQDPTSLLGKILRIDPSGDDFPSDAANNYRVPTDNPFVGESGVRGEIYAFGLRNPFRWSFDTPTGAMILADVGQDAYEELDYIPSGAGGRNLGWSLHEGFHATGNPGPAFSTTLSDPFMEYGHGDGTSIIGGFVYRQSDLGSDLNGRYLFADYVSNRLWAVPISRSGGEAVATSLAASLELGVEGGWNGIVSIDPASNGDVVVTELNAGRVSKLTPVTP